MYGPLIVKIIVGLLYLFHVVLKITTDSSNGCLAMSSLILSCAFLQSRCCEIDK